MADAIELATAYVALVPSLAGAQGMITKALVPAATSAGDDAGKKSGGKFSGAFAAVAGVAAGAAVGTLFLSGFNTSLEGIDARNKVSAQLDLTQAESARAGDVAGGLYADAYGTSLGEVTGAVGTVMGSIKGMADASAADLQDVTGNALDFASVFDVDVSRAAQVAGIAITSGLAEDGAHAFDLLTAAAQEAGPAMTEDVLDASEEYGQFFASLGFDGEEAFGALAGAADMGMYGIDKTGDAIKEFTIRATDMSTSSTAAFDAIGLDAGEMANAILAGGDTARGATQQIVDGLLGIEDPAAQANAAIALFGTPLEDLNTAEIPGFLENIGSMSSGLGDVSGAADEMGEKLNAGPSVALLGMQRAFEGVFTDLATDLMPALETFTGWVEENPGVVQAITIALTGMAVALGIAAVAQWAMNSALLANPITWIVVGIAALIAGLVLLIANWDTVVAFLKDVWGGIVDWLAGVWDDITSGISSAWNGIASFFTGLWTRISTGVTSAWNGIVNWVKGIPARFLAGLSALGSLYLTFGRWILSVKDAAVARFTSLVDWVKGLPGRFLNGLSAIGRLYLDFGRWVLSMKDAAVDKFLSLVDWVKGLPGRIVGALGNVGSLLVNAGKNIIDGFLRGLTRGFDAVKGFVGGIGSWIADNKGPKAYDLALLVPAGGWIMTGLRTGIEDEIPALRATLGRVTDELAVGADISTTASTTARRSATLPAASPAGTGAGTTITVNEANDPVGTALEVARRQWQLGA